MKNKKSFNFNKVEIEHIDGSFHPMAVADSLGNILWSNAKDIATSELGRKIWKSRIEITPEGEVSVEGKDIELTENEINILKEFVPTINVYPHIIKEGILKLFK